MKRIEVKCDTEGCFSEYFGPEESIKERGWSLGKKDYCPDCCRVVTVGLERAFGGVFHSTPYSYEQSPGRGVLNFELKIGDDADPVGCEGMVKRAAERGDRVIEGVASPTDKGFPEGLNEALCKICGVQDADVIKGGSDEES